MPGVYEFDWPTRMADMDNQGRLPKHLIYRFAEHVGWMAIQHAKSWEKMNETKDLVMVIRAQKTQFIRPIWPPRQVKVTFGICSRSGR